MSTDQAALTNNLPSQPESAGSDPLGRALTGRTTWLQRVLSPWSRRWLLQRQVDPAPADLLPLGQRPLTALTTTNTQTILARARRWAGQTATWRPDGGPNIPRQLDHFTRSVINRFPDVTLKYQFRPLTTERVEPAELPLVGAGELSAPEPKVSQPAFPFTIDQVGQALGLEVPPPLSPTPQPQPSSPVQRQPVQPRRGPFPFTVDEVRAALEQPHFTKAAAAPGEPTLQPGRTLTPSTRSLPPGSRLYSRVEEISTPDKTERPAEPSLPPSTSPEPARVQRSTFEPETSPASPETTSPTRPTVEAARSSSPVERMADTNISGTQTGSSHPQAIPPSPPKPAASQRAAAPQPPQPPLEPAETRPAQVPPKPDQQPSRPQPGPLDQAADLQPVEADLAPPTVEPAEAEPAVEPPLKPALQRSPESDLPLVPPHPAKGVEGQPVEGVAGPLAAPPFEPPPPSPPTTAPPIQRHAEAELPPVHSHPEAVEGFPQKSVEEPILQPELKPAAPASLIEPPTIAPVEPVAASPSSGPVVPPAVQRRPESDLLPVEPRPAEGIEGLRPEPLVQPRPAETPGPPSSAGVEPVDRIRPEPLEGTRPVEERPAKGVEARPSRPAIASTPEPPSPTSVAPPVSQRTPEADLPLVQPPSAKGVETTSPGPVAESGSESTRAIESEAAPHPAEGVEGQPARPAVAPTPEPPPPTPVAPPAAQHTPEADLPLVRPRPAEGVETTGPQSVEVPGSEPNQVIEPEAVPHPAEGVEGQPARPAIAPTPEPPPPTPVAPPAVQRTPKADLPLVRPRPAEGVEGQSEPAEGQPEPAEGRPGPAVESTSPPPPPSGQVEAETVETQPGQTQVVQRSIAQQPRPTGQLLAQPEAETGVTLASPTPQPAPDAPAEAAVAPAGSATVPILPQPRPSIEHPAEPAPAPQPEPTFKPVAPPASQPVPRPDLPPTPSQPSEPVEAASLPLAEPEAPPPQPGAAAAEEVRATPGETSPSVARPAVQRKPELPLPLVQPQPGLAAESGPELVERSPVGRPAAPPETAPPQAKAELEPDLNREVLTRARLSSDLPLIKPRPAIQRAPDRSKIADQPTVIPPGSARPSEHPAPSPTTRSAEVLSLPLAPPIRVEITPSAETDKSETARPSARVPSAPAAQVGVAQRQPAEPGITSPIGESPLLVGPAVVVQRAEEGEPTSSSYETDSGQAVADLDKLARQIYPLIKRMLAVERDRRPFR